MAVGGGVELLLRLRADTAAAVQSIQKVGQETDRMAQMAKAWHAVMGIGAVAAAKALFDVGVSSEVMGLKYRAVFGENTTVLDAWVQANKRAFGVAEDDLQGYLAQLANMLTPLDMTVEASGQTATKVLELANAWSVFSGGEITAMAAADTLTKAVLGQTRGLVELGMKLTEEEVAMAVAAAGADKLTGSAKIQAEAMARLTLITERSGAAVEVYGQAMEGGMGASRDAQFAIDTLKDTLGGLVVQLAPVVSGAASLLSTLTGLLTPVNLLAGTFVGLALHFRSFGALMDAIRLKAYSAGYALAEMSRTTVALSLAVVGVTSVLMVWNRVKADAARRAQEFTATLDTETGAVTENTQAWVANELTKAGLLDDLLAIGLNTQIVTDALGGNAEAQKRVNAAIEANTLTELRVNILGLVVALNDLGAAADTSAGSLADLAEDQARAAGAAAEEAGRLTMLTRLRENDILTTRLATQTGEGLIAQTRMAGVVTEEAAASRGEYNRMLTAAREATLEAAAAADRHAAAIRGVSSAMLEATSPVVAAVSAVERLNAATAAKIALEKTGTASSEALAQAELDVAIATLEAQANLDALRFDPANLETSIDAIGTALGMTDEEVRALLTSLGILNGMTVTTYLDFKYREHPAYTSEMGYTPPSAVPHMQHGGFSSGGMALVGEAGPELVTLPSGARVQPLRGTVPAGGYPTPGGGAQVTVIVQGSVWSSQDLAEEIEKQLVRASARGGTSMVLGGAY